MTEALISISYDELCQLEGMDREVIIEIVEYGIVTPIGRTTDSEWFFETSSIYWIKKASRLHSDLEIDWVSVAMVIELMRQKDELQKENERVQSLLRRFVE